MRQHRRDKKSRGIVYPTAPQAYYIIPLLKCQVCSPPTIGELRVTLRLRGVD